ncbi:MAG: GNAT family N-acetyltransferase [Rhodobacterales bacterium]|nr:MAG: GNAT family N-acetyltransferase [Rhodobacterales bacterium]
MADIRQAVQSDLDAFYNISLKTGHLGRDATDLYLDPKMMGHIYSAPYLLFEPKLAYVIEERDQVVGFCVGAVDTLKFSALLEETWWPGLRKAYPKPRMSLRSTWSADERRSHMIHTPESAPKSVVQTYPAHMHMNLLPHVQGRGFGREMFKHWVQQASRFDVDAIHIGVNAGNVGALRFWESNGFRRLPVQEGRTIWLGLKT